MAKKAILLVRVSTDRQEIDTQKKDLKQLAIADGFNSSELKIIEGVGASAIKLNDIYLQEIETLYNTIENDPDIKAVYAWEISRIGRNETKLFEIKNFLIEHGVQLVIYQPSLRLLNRDGSVNSGIELAFSLFATMAKQEMELRQERFARGKARNKKEGKYCGGRIKLGYRLTKDKHFEENPDTSDIVRTIFNKYANNQASVCALHKELVELGIYNKPSAGYNGVKQMNAILKDEAYIGKNGYPRLISDEVFNAVQAKFATHPKRHKTKYTYFCGGLMKDADSGYTFIPDHNYVLYSLNQVRPRLQLNINYMDFACWFTALYLKNVNLTDEVAQNKEEYETRLQDNKTRIINLQAQREESQKQIDRAIEMNIMQPVHYSTEKMNATIANCEKKIAQYDKEIADLKTDTSHIQQLLDDNAKRSAINLTDELSDSMKREIIEQVIEQIIVKRIEQRYYKIQFINKIGYLDNSYWEYDSRGCGARGAKMYMVDANGAKLDVSQWAREHKRFVRVYNK